MSQKKGGRPRQDAPLKTASPILLAVTDPLDEIAQHVDGTFVVVVRLSGGLYRRRCFLTAAAAERAAHKAQAAGHDPEIFIAELKPLWRLVGAEVAS